MKTVYNYKRPVKPLEKSTAFPQPKKNHPRLLGVFFTLTLLLTSCEKFARVDPPTTQLAAEKVYQSEGTAYGVLSGLYVSSGTLLAGGGYSVSHFGNYLADETDAWGTTAAIQQLATNQLVPTNSYPSTFWQSAYSLIYGCNALLEGIQDNPNLSLTARKQLRGEALFLRATAQFYLANFFGNIPVIQSTDYRENTIMPASTPEMVSKAVISDLIEAANLLPADYTSYANERIRPSSIAAKALLARVYLYAGQYEKAEATSSEVLASPLHALGTLTETFLKNSKETILAYKPTTTFVTAEGGAYILTGKPTVMSLRNSFVQSFATTDQRKTAWTSKITVTGIDYPFAYKYKVKTATTLTEYSVLLRLAEQYLIRSEARARLGRNEDALADLNIIQTRAGLAKVTTPFSQTELLALILNERRYELFSEWGHRWFDLRRLGKLDEVMSTAKTGWKSTAALLPIPQSELNLNKNLNQNPGY